MDEKVFSESLAVKLRKINSLSTPQETAVVQALAQVASTLVQSLFPMKDHE
jgi:hypothetical protein